jgi:hypothetical protein
MQGREGELDPNGRDARGSWGNNPIDGRGGGVGEIILIEGTGGGVGEIILIDGRGSWGNNPNRWEGRVSRRKTRLEDDNLNSREVIRSWGGKTLIEGRGGGVE